MRFSNVFAGGYLFRKRALQTEDKVSRDNIVSIARSLRKRVNSTITRAVVSDYHSVHSG